MMNLSIARLSEEEFLDVKDEWNSLLQKSVTNEAFLLWEWIYSWWEVYEDASRELYLLRGKNPAGETIGIAPFYLQKQTLFGTYKRNVIRFCSSVETYSDHLDLITTKEYEDLFSRAIVKYLIENDKDWDLIKLEGVRENAIIKKYLTSARPELEELLITSVPYTHCPYLVIDRSFEDYLKSFSPKKRQTLLRKRRILMNREEAVFRAVQCDEEPEKYIQELFALHDERARQKGIKTTFSGEDLYKFHNKIVHALLKDGKVLLAFLYKESDPLVSYYCIKHDQKIYYYQAGLSHEGEKRSAGTVLFSLILEDAFKDKCKEFDFLRGSEEYKFYWTKNYRKDYSITVRKDDVANRMAHCLHALYRWGLRQIQKIYKPSRTEAKAEAEGSNASKLSIPACRTPSLRKTLRLH
jgi:CelD/BcsL family acetyltransferase involved in cellulose biosynthesis